MWLRTNSLRLPTDFIDTVWWNSSIACSERMPSSRRTWVAYSGNTLWIWAPPARSRRRRSVRSEPNDVKSVSMDSSFVEVTKNRSGCPARSFWWNTWPSETVSSYPSFWKTPSTTE